MHINRPILSLFSKKNDTSSAPENFKSNADIQSEVVRDNVQEQLSEGSHKESDEVQLLLDEVMSCLNSENLNYQKVIAIIEQALMHKNCLRSHRIKGLWAMGKIYFKMGDTNSAIDSLNALLKIESQDVESLLLLGEVFFSLEVFVKALGFFNEVLVINPRSNRAKKMRNRCLILSGIKKGKGRHGASNPIWTNKNPKIQPINRMARKGLT